MPETPADLSQSSKAVTRESRSNFSASFRFLPREKREALTTIYAFCRLTDDIVDLAQARGVPAESTARELDAWKEKAVRAVKGSARPEDPSVLRELSGVAQKFKIPEEYFTGLIEGCRMDLEKTSYASFEDLYKYCYRVASLVGLMCLEVFGYENPKSKDYAVALGVAFQLTNILRDVRTDAERGRVYIPEDDLSRFGFSRQEFTGLSGGKKFEALMAFEIERAESFYGKARENLDPRDRKNFVAAEIMGSVYHGILEEIRKDPQEVLKRKVHLPRWKAYIKILLGWARTRWGA